MQRFLIKDTAKHIGEKVRVCGWVNTRRAHGKILFIDLSTGAIREEVLEEKMCGDFIGGYGFGAMVV